MRSDSACRVRPVSTCTFHGCVLVPEGAREATSRICAIVSRSTGVGRKARTERRDEMASSTARVADGSVAGRGLMVQALAVKDKKASGGHPRSQHGRERGRKGHGAPRSAIDVDMHEVAGGRA